MKSRDEVNRLLVAHQGGDKEAFRQLYERVYDDLRRVARQQLSRHRTGETLNATCLVHEAYFRLVDETQVPWQDRGYFFAIAAGSMRRIIIDYIGEWTAKKRGGGARASTPSGVSRKSRADGRGSLPPDRRVAGGAAGVLAGHIAGQETGFRRAIPFGLILAAA